MTIDDTPVWQNIFSVKVMNDKTDSQSNIVAIDDTPVWTDIFSDTAMNDKTDARTIPLKSKGHGKCRITCMLNNKSWQNQAENHLLCLKTQNAMQRPARIEFTKKVLESFFFSRRS